MISVLQILGIHEDDIEHAYEMIEKVFEDIGIDNENMEKIEDYLENNKELWDLDDITNSIIGQMFDTAEGIINEEYPELTVSTYANGWASKFHVYDCDMLDVIKGMDADVKKKCLKCNVMEAAGLSKEQFEELAKSDKFDEFLELFDEDDALTPDFTLYESVEELGADNEDNDTRDEDEDDETFGEFLLGAYDNDGTFYYRFSDGQILVEG